MALGLHIGRQTMAAKELANAARTPSRALYESFEQRFGCTDCRTLTGYDFRTVEGYKGFQDSGAKKTRCDVYKPWVVEAALAMVQGER